MRIQNYINEGERVRAEVTIHDDPHSLFYSGKAGTLACTDNRVVHVDGKDVVDISINRVDSFRYRAPSMPKAYLYSGIIFLVFAVLGRSSFPGYSTLAFLIGPVLLATGYWLRTSTLTLNTPSESYEFISRDNSLEEIAHTLRDREME